VPVREIAVRCRGIGVDYGAVHALRDVDVDVLRGRLTVIAGPSGSGKSSMLRALAGLERATRGTIELDGVDVTRWRPSRRRRLRRRAMGVVLQEPSHNLLPYLTAREQLVLAARMRNATGDDVDELLDIVGLADRADNVPAELSGGEQQRVAFAAAAVGTPSIVLADEPTAALDAIAGERLLDAMRDLTRRGTTIVVTSHDLAVIDAADDVVRLRDGVLQR